MTQSVWWHKLLLTLAQLERTLKALLILELSTRSLPLGLCYSPNPPSPPSPSAFLLLPSRCWFQGYFLVSHISYLKFWLKPASCTCTHRYIHMCECTYLLKKFLPSVSMLSVTQLLGLALPAVQTCNPTSLAVLVKKKKKKEKTAKMGTGNKWHSGPAEHPFLLLLSSSRSPCWHQILTYPMLWYESVKEERSWG